jgi:hypothetical protein
VSSYARYQICVTRKAFCSISQRTVRKNVGNP